jgi:PhnB protein
MTSIQPYLFFNGRCEEAMEFYRKALDAEVTALIRYKDAPDREIPPGYENKIIHANFRIGETQIMTSDGRGAQELNFDGFALTLNVASEAEADRYFAALANGGQVHMPLAKTFYSPKFGMVSDRFGILWMIITAAEQTAVQVAAENSPAFEQFAALPNC